MDSNELKRLGFSDSQIARVATQNKPTGNQGFLSSLIQEGGALGGAATGAAYGTALGPLGTLAGAGIGGFLGSLGGGLAESQIRDNKFDLGSNLKEATLDGVLSAGPLKLGKALGVGAKALKAGSSLDEALKIGGKAGAEFKLLNKAGSSLATKSDDLLAKQFRLNPTQQSNFLKKHGVKLTDFAKNESINGIDDVAQKLPQYYDEFGKIAAQVPSFKKSQVIKSLADTYKPLNNSVLPSSKGLGAQLQEVAENIAKKYGDDIPSDVVNQLRQEADSAVRFTLRGTADEGVNRKAGSALRELMQSQADKAGLKSTNGLSFKEVGKRISGLEDISEITGKQQFLGTGSNPLGLANMIGGSGGFVAGGPAGGIVGAGVVQAANSNVGRTALRKGTGKLGSALSGASSANDFGLAGLARRKSLPEMLQAQLGEAQSSNNTDSTAMNPNVNAIPNMTNGQSPVNTNTIPDLAQQVQLMTANAQLAVLEQGGTLEEAQQLVQMIPLLLQSEGIDTSSLFAEEEKELTGDAQKRALTSEAGLRSLDTLDQTLQDDPGAFQRQALPNPFGITGRLTGTTNIRSATDNVVDVIARLRSGAAITQDEANRFAQQLPLPGDSPEDAARKLALVRAELESFVRG